MTAPTPVPAAQPASSGSTSSTTSKSSSTNPAMDMATTIRSLADLKKKSPKVYNAMMQGIGMNICQNMEHEQKAIDQIWEHMRQETDS
jgi:hypothetical protein